MFFIVTFLEILNHPVDWKGPLADVTWFYCVSGSAILARGATTLCRAGLCKVPGTDTQHSCQTTRLLHFNCIGVSPRDRHITQSTRPLRPANPSYLESKLFGLICCTTTYEVYKTRVQLYSRYLPGQVQFLRKSFRLEITRNPKSTKDLELNDADAGRLMMRKRDGCKVAFSPLCCTTSDE
ncbi:hypothetical protein PQQ51_10340 [Paraburkholderia xenovorans]|uniref:hypothetical protein n=1 Tax=Paraburkholderia xenovorans TaxID=36873 RepID=UPI0038B837F9